MYVCGLLLASSVALGLAYWIQGIALKSARLDVERQRVENDRLEAEKAKLLGSIREQNDAIAKLGTVAEEKSAAAALALAQAHEFAKRYEDSRRRVAALLLAPTPPGADCTQAVAVVRQELSK